MLCRTRRFSTTPLLLLFLLLPGFAAPQQRDSAASAPIVKERGARRPPLPRGTAPTPWVVINGPAPAPRLTEPAAKNGAIFGAAGGPRLACGTNGTTPTPPPSSGGSGSFNLKIYEGYRFSDRTVVKSDDKTADVVFYPSLRSSTPLPILAAAKIEEFQNRPDVNSLSAGQIAGWDENIFAPAGGYYYVIRGKDNRYYLLSLTDFENGGRAMTYWQLKFTWQEIQMRP